jgi:hypothetical protein
MTCLGSCRNHSGSLAGPAVEKVGVDGPQHSREVCRGVVEAAGVAEVREDVSERGTRGQYLCVREVMPEPACSDQRLSSVAEPRDAMRCARLRGLVRMALRSPESAEPERYSLALDLRRQFSCGALTQMLAYNV